MLLACCCSEAEGASGFAWSGRAMVGAWMGGSTGRPVSGSICTFGFCGGGGFGTAWAARASGGRGCICWAICGSGCGGVGGCGWGCGLGGVGVGCGVGWAFTCGALRRSCACSAPTTSGTIALGLRAVLVCVLRIVSVGRLDRLLLGHDVLLRLRGHEHRLGRRRRQQRNVDRLLLLRLDQLWRRGEDRDEQDGQDDDQVRSSESRMKRMIHLGGVSFGSWYGACKVAIIATL